MKIQHNMTAITDEDAALRVGTEFFHGLNLLEERVNVDDTTTTDQILTLRAHDARWQDVNVKCLSVVHDRVTSIVTTLALS